MSKTVNTPNGYRGMKSFSEEITIYKSQSEVIALITAIEHYPKWQPDLIDYQTFSGVPLEAGAKTRLVYREGKNDNIKLVETVVENNLPHSLKFKHSTEGVISFHNHIFTATEPGQTLYRMECEYDFDGLMKVMSIFTASHFKKQVQKFMESFKAFVEGYQNPWTYYFTNLHA